MGNQYTFKLKKIVEVKSKVLSIIGEPIPYEDLKSKGDLEQFLPTKKINEAASTLKIKEVKEMQKGRVAGAVVGKVIRRPDKVNSFMNIMIEDEQK